MARFFTPEVDTWLFRCRCLECTLAPHGHLVDLLDALRAHCGRPVMVNSGPRCHSYNAKLIQDGKPAALNSTHTFGLGVDLRSPNGGETYALVDAAIQVGFRRIGIGGTFVHVDVCGLLGACTHIPPHPCPWIWRY